jgi:hypothetical protein
LSGSPPTSGRRPPSPRSHRPRRLPRRRPASLASRASSPPPLLRRRPLAPPHPFFFPRNRPTTALHRAPPPLMAPAATNRRPPPPRPFPFPLGPIKGRHHPLFIPRPSLSLLPHRNSTARSSPPARRSAASIRFTGAVPSLPSPQVKSLWPPLRFGVFPVPFGAREAILASLRRARRRRHRLAPPPSAVRRRPPLRRDQSRPSAMNGPD